MIKKYKRIRLPILGLPILGLAISVLVIIVLAMLVLAGCSQKEESPEKEEISFGERYVEVAMVLRKDVSSYLDFSGKIKADNAISVSPSISGIVRDLFVTEGDMVKSGELLAKLDAAQLRQIEIQLINLEKNYLRMQELKKSGSINEQSFDEVETAVLAARSSREFLRNNTEIRAPFAGMISKISANKNELFDMMMDPYLFRIVSNNNLKTCFQVSDIDVAFLKKNMPVIIKVDTYPKTEFSGIISFIGPEADILSGTYSCEILLNEIENNFMLRHNQFARIRVLTKTSINTLAIPPKALVEDNCVFVADGNVSIKSEVTIGIGNPEEIEITSGLLEGNLVIIKGNIGMNSGNKISYTFSEERK